LVEKDLCCRVRRWTAYLAPRCPPLILVLNSILILVTSFGRIRAPGPTRIHSSYSIAMCQQFVHSARRQIVLGVRLGARRRRKRSEVLRRGALYLLQGESALLYIN
jgi:hypothetical protein